MYLQYADLVFKLVYDEQIELTLPQNTHPSFFSTIDETAVPDFTIFIEQKNFVLPKTHLTEISPAPNAPWKLYQQDHTYYIVSNFVGNNVPKWIMQFDQKTFAATIYCDDSMIEGRNEINGKIILKNPFCYPLDQIYMIFTLSHRNGLILHASGTAISGKGYIFPGISGTGKSTIANLFITNGLTNWLGDDRVIVRKVNDKFFVYGTPWVGTNSDPSINTNFKVPLANMFFVTRGEDAILTKLAASYVIKKLIPTISIAWNNPNYSALSFNILEDLVKEIPAYEFCYKPGKKAFEVIANFILS